MSELTSRTLSEPVELTSTELDTVAGGNFGALAKAEVRQTNYAAVFAGTHNSVTTGAIDTASNSVAGAVARIT